MTNIDFFLRFTQDTSADAMTHLADEALQAGAKSLLVLAADANDCKPEDFDSWLARCPGPVFGGVFPQLMHDNRNHEQGYIVVGLGEAVEACNVSGLSATRAIRNFEALAGVQPVPVYALTANAMASDRDACLAAGMDGHLAKPLKRVALEAVLREISAQDRITTHAR